MLGNLGFCHSCVCYTYHPKRCCRPSTLHQYFLMAVTSFSRIMYPATLQTLFRYSKRNTKSLKKLTWPSNSRQTGPIKAPLTDTTAHILRFCWAHPSTRSVLAAQRGPSQYQATVLNVMAALCMLYYDATSHKKSLDLFKQWKSFQFMFI